MTVKLLPIFLLIACNLTAQSFPIFENSPIWQLSSFGIFGSGSIEVTVNPSIDTNQAEDTCVPQVCNCIFRNNQAFNGGAVYCNGNRERFASPQFFNCTFIQNRGEGQGGAVFKEGQNPEGVALRFIDCDFERNWARSSGAGVGLFDVGGEIVFSNCSFSRDTAISGSAGINFETYLTGIELLIENCNFTFNQGSDGGAFNLIHSSFSTPNGKNRIKITSSMFVGNEGKVGPGGAISITSSAIVSELSIEKSHFEGNFSQGRGGAIFALPSAMADSRIFLSSSIFRNNFVKNFPGGGAISISGSSFDEGYKESHLEVFNSLFENNSGIVTLGTGTSGVVSSAFTNCTFYKNGEFPFAKGRSDIVQRDSLYAEIRLANSIIWEPILDFSNIFVNGSPDNRTLYDYHFEHCLISAQGCDLPGGDVACGANNIFEKDPEIIDPSNGNFALHGCSPAINQGNNNLLSEFSMELDLALQDRIQENRVDLGAYEQPSSNLMIEDLYVIPPSCHDSKDGKVTALVPDNPDLKYSWQNASNSGEGNINLTSGVYQFTVTDSNNCKGNFIISIDAPDSINASYDLVHPADDINGAIGLNDISGGTPP